MIKLVLLHDLQGDEIYVNPEHVTRIRKPIHNYMDANAEVHADGQFFYVKEQLHEVVGMLLSR